MKTILLLGTTVAVVYSIVELSRRTRANQRLQEKVHQLQDHFKSLDQV